MDIEKMAQLNQSELVKVVQSGQNKEHSLNLIYHPRDGGNV